MDQVKGNFNEQACFIKRKFLLRRRNSVSAIGNYEKVKLAREAEEEEEKEEKRGVAS